MSIVLVCSLAVSGCAASPRGKLAQGALLTTSAIAAGGWLGYSVAAMPSPFVDGDPTAEESARRAHDRDTAHVFSVVSLLSLTAAVLVGVADRPAPTIVIQSE